MKKNLTLNDIQKLLIKPLFILQFTKFILVFLIYLFVFYLINYFNLLFYNLNKLNDLQQNEIFKVFYIHVPIAWLSSLLYFFLFLISINYLFFSIKILEIFFFSIAKIGLIFSFIMLFTGSIWGLLTWGTLWVWDIRLTSSLILFLFYLLFYFIYYFFNKNLYLNYILMFFTILGIINIIIIKLSINWWNTLHQIKSLDSFNSEYNTLFLYLIFFYLFFYLFFILLYLFLELRKVILLNKIMILNKLYLYL